jgi:hypothetical protein
MLGRRVPLDDALKLDGLALQMRSERSTVDEPSALPSPCGLAPIVSGPQAKAFDVA